MAECIECWWRPVAANSRGSLERASSAAQRLAVAAKMADSHQLPSEILRQTVTNSLETCRNVAYNLNSTYLGDSVTAVGYCANS